MREVNFSIPNVNKASVGITTALYDRRALDCTSTLPLINSLNHLAYLTTSSARIRDILTVDGGVERLVCILKEGRSKDLMSMWKWNLAFQCVVNIGVRGSEAVRTRVVEADMVPVIATILDNYIQVIDRFRAKAENSAKRSATANQVMRSRDHRQSSSFDRADRATSSGDRSFRRFAAPSSIDTHSAVQQGLTIPVERRHADLLASHVHHHQHHHHHHHTTNTAADPLAYGRYHHSHGRAQDGRHLHLYQQGAPLRDLNVQPLAAALPTMDMSVGGIGLQPVRDADRLPSMVGAGGPSQPVSPTTPNPPASGTSFSRAARRNSRASLRHQRSMSGESDDANSDEIGHEALPPVNRNEPIVDIQTDVDMEHDSMLESVDAPMALTGTHGTDTQVAETFNITHRSPIDGSIVNPAGNVNNTMGFSPNQPVLNPTLAVPAPFQVPSRYMVENSPFSVVLPSMPREEDVLMSLQLLAYVSKYCNLRSYFQESHLVPKLSISREMHLLDEEAGRRSPTLDEEQEEYVMPDDYNIFPLVEKFTVRHHPQDMQYWAGVVMRNLCRKDDSRGGIRQCAYYECGKWEECTRQFAKCRRCRRTKYCSKECQKSAWVYHRHWCIAAAP